MKINLVYQSVTLADKFEIEGSRVQTERFIPDPRARLIHSNSFCSYSLILLIYCFNTPPLLNGAFGGRINLMLILISFPYKVSFSLSAWTSASIRIHKTGFAILDSNIEITFLKRWAQRVRFP